MTKGHRRARRHSNTTGYRQIQRGKTRDDIKRIARKLGIPMAKKLNIDASNLDMSDLALIEACDSRFGSLTLYGRGSVHLILEQLKSYLQEGTAATASAPEDRSWMMNQAAFEKMIAENLAWLDSLPHSLERSHVREIVRNCVKHYYPAPLPVPPQVHP